MRISDWSSDVCSSDLLMSELRDLYQEIILDHNKRPRNFRKPEHPTHEAHGNNPLCGDKVTVYVTVEDGIVKDVAFEGRGCAIRSEERRVGKECGRQCRSRWSASH